MATGYTYSIISKEGTTFEKFALDCARAFGACITIRDDFKDKEIPEEFPVPDYHLKELEKAEKDFEEFKKLTENEIEKLRIKYYKHAVKEYEKSIKKDQENLKKYIVNKDGVGHGKKF